MFQSPAKFGYKPTSWRWIWTLTHPGCTTCSIPSATCCCVVFYIFILCLDIFLLVYFVFGRVQPTVHRFIEYGGEGSWLREVFRVKWIYMQFLSSATTSRICILAVQLNYDDYELWLIGAIIIIIHRERPHKMQWEFNEQIKREWRSLKKYWKWINQLQI